MSIKKYFNRIFYLILRRFDYDDSEKIFDKILLIFTILIQLAFIVSFILALHERLWTTAFLSLVAMVVIWIPIRFTKRRRIHIPISFEFLLTLFIYASLFLGEIQGYYTRFWWWDTVLHLASGIGLGFIGFLIVYSVHQKGSLLSNIGILAVFSFCFALSLGALWEIFEFAMDSFFDLNMQKTETGVVNTMWDLIMDATGALLVSWAGYFYMKNKKYGLGVFHYFLTSYIRKNNLGK